MKIQKRDFNKLEQYYEIKLGVRSLKRQLSSLEFYAQGNKEVIDQLGKAHQILIEMEFEK